MASPYYDKIRTKALRYAKICGLNRNEAEDIAQDVVLWYIENPESADQRKVKFVTVDAIRARFNHKRRVKILYMPDPVWTEKAIQPSVDQVENVYRLMRPGLERAAFVLSNKWGLTNEEIAEAFGISPVAVARAMTYAIIDLKKDFVSDKQRENRQKKV